MDTFAAIMSANNSNKLNQLVSLFNDEGGNTVSNIIQELIGQRCKMILSTPIVGRVSQDIECLVLDVDRGWVKILVEEKKDKNTHLIRLSNIMTILLLQ